MNRNSNLIRFVFSIFFALAVALNLPITLTTITAENVLFQPSVYKHALVANHFYDKLPGILADQIARTPAMLEGQGPIDIDPQIPGEAVQKNAGRLRYLNRTDFEYIFSQLFTKQWLQSQTESAIDQLFEYVNLEAPLPRLLISTVAIKQRLVGPVGLQIMHHVVNSWPPCSPDLLITVMNDAIQGDLQAMPVCRPPQAMMSLFDPLYKTTLNNLVKRLPDQVDLSYVLPGIKEIAGPPPSGELATISATPWQLDVTYHWLRESIRFSPILLAFSLLGLVISRRVYRDRLAWWGSSLAAGGILGLLVGLAGPGLMQAVIVQATNSVSHVLSASPIGFLQQLLSQLINRYFLWISLEAAVLIGLGLSLLVFWRIWEKR